MPKAFTRYALKGYKGVFFILGTDPVTGEAERIFYIRYRTPDGKMVEEKAGRTGRPDRMTPAKARGIREDRLRGIDLPNRKKREVKHAEVKAAAERWMFDKRWAEWKKGNTDKKSIVNDNSRYMAHLHPLFGHKEPREVTPFEVDRLRLAMLKGKAAAPGRKFGLNAKRRAEIRNLKWSDVDFDRGFILLRDPKSGEDERIPLGDAAIGVIKAHQRVQQVTPNSDAAAALLEAGFQSASSLTESQYVFTGEKDGPRGLRQIGESSRAIRDAAGLPKDFRPNHGLLHTFASHLASSGEVDLYILQKMMTHKGPLMTQRYAHLTDAALKRGADVMSRIVKEAKETA